MILAAIVQIASDASADRLPLAIGPL